MLEGEEIVGAFMPDKAFKRRSFRSAFLASFITLLLVIGSDIAIGIPIEISIAIRTFKVDAEPKPSVSVSIPKPVLL